MGRYNQYPDDYIASKIVGLKDGLKGSRLVIHRDMDLVHYIYTERIDDNNYIGFCLIFNKVRLLKPKKLIELFRLIIEERMVNSGHIIKYSTEGKLQYIIKSFNESIKEYEKLKFFINSELESNYNKYNIEELHSIYNGEKSSVILDNMVTDAQIISLTDKHNYVFVNEDAGIENGYIQEIMTSIRTQNINANKEIEELHSKIVILNRRKNQYRKVVLLFILVIFCFMGLFALYNNLDRAEQNLVNSMNRLELAQDTIRILNANILTKTNEISALETRCMQEETKRREGEALINDITSQYPIIIRNTSFDFSRKILKIEYYAADECIKDVKVKAFSDSSNQLVNISKGNNISFYKGNGSLSSNFSYSFNSSNWYTFEIWVGGRLVGGGRH